MSASAKPLLNGKSVKRLLQVFRQCAVCAKSLVWHPNAADVPVARIAS